jgi:hypothetical protein
MSNIDQSHGPRWVHDQSITDRPWQFSVTERDRKRSRQMQGSVMTSTPPFLTAIERHRCSRCQTRMMLERVSSGPIGFEHRLFECPKCDHVEINVIASDPFKSKAAGWLDGELRTPN